VNQGSGYMPVTWKLIGKWTFDKGSTGYVEVQNRSTSEGWVYVYADAIKFVYAGVPSEPPVLGSIGNKTVNEGSLLEFTLNAVDPEGDALTYSASNLPSGASFNFSTRAFSWTPSYMQAGTYTNVHFEVTDGKTSDSENITITVNNVNRAPVLGAIGNKTINEGSLLQFIITASDPDSDAITYSASNLPSGASFNSSTRTFSWTPALMQRGTYSGIRFGVTDGNLTDYEDITITVNNAAFIPPTANISANLVNGEVPLEVQFTGSGTDSDGSIASYGWDFGDGTSSSEQNPSHVYQNPGIYIVVLKVTDNDGAKGTASVTISVTSKTPLSGQIPQTIRFQGRLTDKNKSPLSGVYDITFRIYDAESGSTNSKLWEEIHTDVQIQNGIVDVLLGSIKPISLKFDKYYWLSTEVGSDGEMMPRQKITSVGYAYKAQFASKGGTAVYTGQGEITDTVASKISMHTEIVPSSVKLYIWADDVPVDGTYPDGLIIEIDGIDVTSSLLALANINWQSNETRLGNGTSGHPLVSGSGVVTGTGGLDITALNAWSSGEHTIAIKHSTSGRARVRHNVYINY
jgi:PKD repeat protein